MKIFLGKSQLIFKVLPILEIKSEFCIWIQWYEKEIMYMIIYDAKQNALMSVLY